MGAGAGKDLVGEFFFDVLDQQSRDQNDRIVSWRIGLIVLHAVTLSNALPLHKRANGNDAAACAHSPRRSTGFEKMMAVFLFAPFCSRFSFARMST
jgi:hypothetical protein